MIEVRYKARLGNRMFQYCLGRILAEELGFGLVADPLPGFPNTGQKIEGILVKDPLQVLTDYRINLHQIRTDRSPRRIIVDGWFQRYEYYRPWRRQIQQWLAVDPTIRQTDVECGTVVHVRRADYVDHGWALPFSYYDEALETLGPHDHTIWIVTDDRRDPFLRNFSKWRPKLFAGNHLETMLLMSHAKQLVISQSTFGWWPTFLGTAEKIICPVPEFGIWSDPGGERGIDLIERDRFICLPCPKPYRPTLLETAYQRLRPVAQRAADLANRNVRRRVRIPT